MFKKNKFSQNKKMNVANICIKSLKNFDEQTFEKLENIIKLFSNDDLFCDFEILEKNASDIFLEFKNVKETREMEWFKNKKGIAQLASTKAIREILMLIKKYDLKESLFCDPQKIRWEQVLLNGIDEKNIVDFSETDVLISLYDHAGYHHIVYNTTVYDFESIKNKVSDICNN